MEGKEEYYSIFHSHFLYNTNIISIKSQTKLNKISQIQRTAIRTTINSAYNAQTEPLFLNLKILPFNKIIHLKKALFMHAAEYGYNLRRQDLRNTDRYILPFIRIEKAY
jgi:hypothetical protein